MIFDGVLLLRPDLVDVWDFSVFLSVGIDEILRRVRLRDAELFGSSDAAERRYWTRYLAGQQLYVATAHPERTADVALRYDDPVQPIVDQMPIDAESTYAGAEQHGRGAKK